jgi:hypothetical protein
MFPRVTHPSATPVLLRAFDLHVLSLPPAFALSQDQTLKLDENFEPAWSRITFDEVHHNALPQLAPRTNVVLYLLRERVPPKSLPTALLRIASREERSARTTPSTFLFLPIHLSNNPDPRVRSDRSPHTLRQSRRAVEACPPTEIGWLVHRGNR